MIRSERRNPGDPAVELFLHLCTPFKFFPPLTPEQSLQLTQSSQSRQLLQYVQDVQSVPRLVSSECLDNLTGKARTCIARGTIFATLAIVTIFVPILIFFRSNDDLGHDSKRLCL